MSLLRGVSFDHLKKRTKEVTLPGCFVRSEHEVVLVLQHAGEDNAGWINAYRKADAEMPLHDRTPREWFDALVPAFAEFSVVGWKHVVNEHGGEEPISVAGVVEVMQAYAEVAIDLACRPIYMASNVNNFRDYKPPQIDVDALGKG